jgi:Na+/proline symporter
VLCLVEVGGVGGLFGLIESRGVGDDFKLIHDPGRFDANQFTLLWAAAMFLKTAFAYNGLAAASRYFAVKDGAAARKAALVAMVGMLVGITIWLLPPVTARLLYEDAVLAAELAKPAESSYAIASVMLLPTGLVGLMVAAMFAATMSSMDSGLNKNAAIITQDLYPLISRLRGHGEREGAGRLRLAKVISLALGATVISLALFFAGIEGRGAFGIMLTVGAMLALPLAVPLLLCLFIKRVPGWSAMAAAGAALIPSIIGYFQGWNFQTQVLVNVVVGVAAFFACMPAWRFAPPAYRDKVDAFFTRMHTPVDFEQEVGQSSDRQQLNIIGGFALIIGSAILLLLLLPNPWLGRLGILFVAGTLLLVGTLMRWYGRGAAHPVQDPSATPQPLPDLA